MTDLLLDLPGFEYSEILSRRGVHYDKNQEGMGTLWNYGDIVVNVTIHLSPDYTVNSTFTTGLE